jgi:hypothetical protein
MGDSGQHQAGPLETHGGSAPASPIAATAAVEWAGMPSVLTPTVVASLQRSAGNRAVTRLLQRMAPGSAGHVPLLGAVAGGLYGAFAAGLAYQGQFKADVQAARSRPVWRAEWDAWGHAVTGAYTTSAGSAGEAHALGSTIESAREGLRGLGIMEHDSYTTDTYNQAVGRDIATRHGGDDLIAACTQAYLSGRLMVGPGRDAVWLPWMPARDWAPVFRHESRSWVSAEGSYAVDPANWVEAVDPGERGLARGRNRRPDSPLPVGADGVEFQLSNPHADLS